jgi:hypothetical protein
MAQSHRKCRHGKEPLLRFAKHLGSKEWLKIFFLDRIIHNGISGKKVSLRDRQQQIRQAITE